jgi:hypothetical protein
MSIPINSCTMAAAKDRVPILELLVCDVSACRAWRDLDHSCRRSAVAGSGTCEFLLD